MSCMSEVCQKMKNLKMLIKTRRLRNCHPSVFCS
ncbi:unnamed protein product [Arabidopsis halleri]